MPRAQLHQRVAAEEDQGLVQPQHLMGLLAALAAGVQEINLQTVPEVVDQAIPL